MNGRHLAKIARRLTRVRNWLNDRDRRGDLNRLLDDDLPDLIRTVREHNMRGQQGNCRYCGQPLRLAHGPKAGLYAMYTTEDGVLCQDPKCPSPDSPDGLHHAEGTEDQLWKLTSTNPPSSPREGGRSCRWSTT